MCVFSKILPWEMAPRAHVLPLLLTLLPVAVLSEVQRGIFGDVLGAVKHILSKKSPRGKPELGAQDDPSPPGAGPTKDIWKTVRPMPNLPSESQHCRSFLSYSLSFTHNMVTHCACSMQATILTLSTTQKLTSVRGNLPKE